MNNTDLVIYNYWNSNFIFRYPFEGSDALKETFSQAWQDIFVLSLLGGKQHGTYLEIGSSYADFTNNTFLLSKNFNWSGISVELKNDYVERWNNLRPGDELIIADALTLDYRNSIHEKMGQIDKIDYLQVDIDPSEYTLQALKKLPHDSIRFGIITFETDNNYAVRSQSREFLSNLGYELIVGDVLVHYESRTYPYEDWWVDLNLVNRDVALSIKNHANQEKDPVKLLFQ
jgi:hypothetical protein